MRAILASLLLLTLFTLAPAFGADTPDPGPAKPGWRLVFADEFNGATADLDKNWDFQNHSNSHILCSRWRENIIEENGLCRILNKKENRGGQEWTSGCMWTRPQFKYGYFECRYRYGATTGQNNSFWLMTQGKKSEEGLFEIDINEGHYPNEINTNVHKWSGEHKGIGKAFRIGAEPGQTFEQEAPITTDKLRLVVRDGGQARVQELRAFAYRKEGGYPPLFPAKGAKAPAPQNLALGAKAAATSEMKGYPAAKAVDGALGTASRWVTAPGETGPHTLTVDLGQKQPIGCVQLITGWQDQGVWKDMLSDFSIEAWDGAKWVEFARSAGSRAGLAQEFHIYALEWNEQELIYYFDGKELRRQPNEWCHRAAPVWVSDAIIRWAGPIDPRIDGSSMDVDYVRVYQK